MDLPCTISFLLITVVCSSFVIAQERGEEFMVKAKECQKKFEISDEIYQYVLKTMQTMDENNASQRCLVECLLTAEGFMNNEKLDTEKIVEQTKKESEKVGLKLNENTLRTTINDCKKLGGEGKCSASYNSWKCFFNMMMKGLPYA
ncbi:hypothetical protein C0J52_23910 [Blattella germanica]|nr:hypothetical protein C0J52_23910 [Blattella germanica]